jgi:hypothetical protein
MRPERLKILLVFSALLMLAFTGELVAQTISFAPDGEMVYYGNEIDLTATVSGGSQPDTVLYAIEVGTGSLSPDSDTTIAGEATVTFTASTTNEDVTVAVYLVSGDLSDTLDAGSVDVLVRPAPETLTLTDPGEAIVPDESINIYATLTDEDDGAVEDTVVNFSIASGDGGVSPASDTTDDSGVAVTVLTAGSSAGPRTIRVAAYWTDGDISLTDTVDVLVAVAPTDLVFITGDPTIGLNGSQAIQARLTRSGTGVNGLAVDFYVTPGLGDVDPESDLTEGGGYANTTYTAETTSGTDTVFAVWTDEELTRTVLIDTLIVTINPGAATSLNVTPGDTIVVVTEDATITVELLDDFLNHVDATDPAQVSFTTDGHGTFGAAVVSDGLIEVAYTTDDTVATDIITTTLVSNSTRDYDTVRTIGGTPTGMYIWIGDTIVVAGGIDPGYEAEKQEYFNVALFDQYGNRTIWSDYYADETHPVDLSVSTGGGQFQRPEVPYDIIDTAYVDSAGISSPGTAEANYLTSQTTGVYTITCTSGAAQATKNIVQICDIPDSVVLAPDSIGIPAGSDTVLVATLYDKYGNYCEADDARFVGDTLEWDGFTAKDEGDMDPTYIEDHNWKGRYYSYPLDADTAWIWVEFPDEWLPEVRSKYSDTVVVFSAVPGDLHHFDITLLDIMGENFDDHAWVSDYPDTSTINAVLIEAQDDNNIRLWTYDNSDTLTLTLDGSSAGASQVVWYIPDSIPPEDGDSFLGTTAFIAPGGFAYGLAAAGVINQVAETVTITATDTAGHTGTSPALTWLPIDVVGFDVALEGGATQMETMEPANVEVTAIDRFGNTTDVGLPLNIVLSANRSGIQFPGETHLMESSVVLFSTIATEVTTGLIIEVSDFLNPLINGQSYEIEVIAGGIADIPIVSGITAEFASGNIVCALATEGPVEVKVYDKVGREVATLLSGNKKPGYYPVSLEGLNLASDVYFVVMEGPNVSEKAKVTLIK